MRKPPSQVTPTDQKTGKRARRRWLLWSAASFFALVLSIAAFALLLVQSEWGARVLWQSVSRMLPGQLSGEFLGGSLDTGVSLRDVVYRDANVQIRIDRFES